jgi:hypothetical protein
MGRRKAEYGGNGWGMRSIGICVGVEGEKLQRSRRCEGVDAARKGLRGRGCEKAKE